MKFKFIVLCVAALVAVFPAVAQQGVAPADMSTAEVRKIDLDTKKITLKHGEIKSLDMPPMTMVFQVKDAAMLDKLKPGDKVRFVAQKSPTGFLITQMEAAP
jgi:Cu(I)/Ag(I) efflux system periplasmic protein CusF